MQTTDTLTEKKETQNTWQNKHGCEQIFNYKNVLKFYGNKFLEPMKCAIFKENGFIKN